MGELFLRYEYPLAASQLMLAMLGMGATLRVADFVEVLRYPTGIVLGLALQLLGVPLLAFATGRLFGLEPGLAVGLVLVAAVPGGTLSNVLTYFARANVPLSISLTAVTTLGSLVTTPVVLALFASAHLAADFEMPVARIAGEIAYCLLGPLSLGMALGNAFPSRREALASWSIRASLGVIALMVVGAVSADRVDAMQYGGAALGTLVLFSAAVFVAGYAVCTAAGLRSEDRMAIAIEACFRNTSLALLVKASAFPVVAGVPDPVADGAFFVALLYAGLAGAVVTGPVVWHRRARAV